jgi:5'-nucleotidase
MDHRSMWRRAGAAAAVAAVLVLSACGSSTETSSTTTTAAGATASSSTTPGSGTTPGSTPGTTAQRTLKILVTNDDGYAAPGIDAVVNGLQTLPNVEVVVVAPAANQSGTGAQTTDGPLTATEVTTTSGYPAKAVAGFPADTIVWAIDQGGIDFTPDLVISGINVGQNIGPLTALSGTVGAARAAGSRGIPALASSQGIAAEPDWPSGVALVLEWVTEHRLELLAGGDASPAVVENINIPTCTNGTLRQLVEVPVATDAAGRDLTASDCSGTPPQPTADIDAFITGFPSLSDITPAA